MGNRLWRATWGLMARSEGTNIIYIRFLLSRAQSVQFSSVQLLCRVRLRDAMNRSMPGCPSPTPGVHSNSGPSSRWYHPTVSSSTDHFSSSLKSFPASESFQMSQLFRQVARVLEFQSIVTWPQLNICPPAFTLSQHQVFANEPALHIRWSKHRSFSFSISPSNEYSGLTSFKIDWVDLLGVQRSLKSLNTKVQKQNSLALSPTLTSIHD